MLRGLAQRARVARVAGAAASASVVSSPPPSSAGVCSPSSAILCPPTSAVRSYSSPPGFADDPIARDDTAEFVENKEGKVIVDGIDYTGYLPEEEFKETHLKKLQETFGEGTGDLYRGLYRDLCDELRREKQLKPPAPNSHFGDWRMQHENGKDWMTFSRKAGNADVLVGGRLSMRDPSQINETLTFLSWYPLEVLIKRDAYIMHFQMSVAEVQLYPRNIRCYHDPNADIFKFDADADFERHFRRYDGPFMKHLELDMQTEMFDLLFDVGITTYVGRMMADWIHYFEHVEHVRWLLRVMDRIMPDTEYLHSETQLLTLEERRALDEIVEEWRDEAKV
jgi:hypothetical protein